MNTLARTMGITCTADVGLVSIEYTCIDKQETFSQTLCLTTTGVNTAKLSELENFVLAFPSKYALETSEHIHKFLDHIEHRPGHYHPTALGLAAAVACSTFSLGGGPDEVLCAFFGAPVWQLATGHPDEERGLPAPLRCQQRSAGLSGICGALKRAGADLSRLNRTSGGIYLLHAVYYSRISVHYKRHRPGETGYAFWTGTSRLLADHRCRSSAGGLGHGAYS